jgi:orotidine-5'-phosphate decarboxylase
MSADAKPTHAADRLIAAIEAKRAPVCVGLDPVADRLPAAIVEDHERLSSGNATSFSHYCMHVIDAIASTVPCVKLQSACFERYRASGFASLCWVVKYAHERNVEVILDAKRGDIGISADHYAASAFEPLDAEDKRYVADWLTINSYLGEDGIAPFLKKACHGAFALARTSNPGGDQVQNLELKDGRTVAHAVGEMIARIGSGYVGQRGYSSLGAVVGATKPQDARRLREIMPQQIFLVPGYGAQGGGLDDVLPCFKSDGSGAIVTASRSIIYAFKSGDSKWADSVADAAAKFADEIGRAVGMR